MAEARKEAGTHPAAGRKVAETHEGRDRRQGAATEADDDRRQGTRGDRGREARRHRRAAESVADLSVAVAGKLIGASSRRRPPQGHREVRREAGSLNGQLAGLAESRTLRGRSSSSRRRRRRRRGRPQLESRSPRLSAAAPSCATPCRTTQRARRAASARSCATCSPRSHPAVVAVAGAHGRARRLRPALGRRRAASARSPRTSAAWSSADVTTAVELTDALRAVHHREARRRSRARRSSFARRSTPRSSAASSSTRRARHRREPRVAARECPPGALDRTYWR